MRARAKQANLESKKANEILLAFKKLDAQRELEADAAIAGQCAVLCCALLCCALVDLTLLCCAVLCLAGLCCSVSPCAPCHAMLSAPNFIACDSFGLAPWQPLI